MNVLTWHDDAIRDGSSVWARVSSANVLDARPDQIVGAGVARVVVRSGWMAMDPDAGPVLSWTAGPRAKLDQAIEGLLPVLRERGATLLIRPALGDMVSDIPSALGIIRKWSNQPVGLLVEPSALLTESMIERVADHLQRIGEALGEHDATAGILLTNVAFPHGTAKRVPTGDGVIPPAMLDDFARAAHAAGKPVIVLPEDASRLASL